MLTEALVIAFFVMGLQLMVPILWAALGETIVEQSGVLNVGIEGVMLIGALVTALVGINLGSLPLAILAAVGSGLLCGGLLSYLYVRRGTDQIVTGLLFNMFAVGFTGVIHTLFLAGQIGVTLSEIKIPGIRSIKWVGEVLSKQNIMLYVGLLLAAGVYYLLHRTWWGLYARAASQRPTAVEAAGLSVWRLRYPALLIGCTLSSVAGSALVLGTSGGFVPGMTAGRGFIALGVVVVARWRPTFVILGATLFGMTQGLQFLAGRLTALQSVPTQVWLALPYLITVAAVVLAPGSRYPAAIGIPYKGQGRRRLA
ncbi:MAG: ABC transporter permease [Actinomycetota bacterium]